MRTLLLAASSAVLLTGCNATVQNHILDNLEGCTRHYDGAVNGSFTGAGFTGTVKVDCTPQTPPAP